MAFWSTTKKCETKIQVNFLSSSGIKTGRVNAWARSIDGAIYLCISTVCSINITFDKFFINPSKKILESWFSLLQKYNSTADTSVSLHIVFMEHFYCALWWTSRIMILPASLWLVHKPFGVAKSQFGSYKYQLHFGLIFSRRKNRSFFEGNAECRDNLWPRLKWSILAAPEFDFML